MTFTRDPLLGLVPKVPCPFYCWQFWQWQKVRCKCGAQFISRDLGLMPPEYVNHYYVTHLGGTDDKKTGA